LLFSIAHTFDLPIFAQAPQFGRVSNYAIAAMGSFDDGPYIRTADINGDGYPDILVVTLNTKVTALLNDGTGKFGNRVDTDLGGQLFGIGATGDFNSDGRLDLAVVMATGIGIFAGDGTGHFASLGALNQVTVNNGCVGQISSADLNRDGKVDLIVDCRKPDGSPVLLTYLGRGDGTFASPLVTVRNSPRLLSHQTMAVADFNNDGLPDVVGATQTGFEVLIGSGDGTFLTPISQQTNPGYAMKLTVGDLNGDGNIDILVQPNDPSVTPGDNQPSNGNSLVVYLGDGKGNFRPLAPFQALVPGFSSNGGYFHDIEIADLNGDGVPDIAVTKEQFNDGVMPEDWLVLLGKGDGTYGPPIDYTQARANCYSCLYPVPAYTFVVADLNGDGSADLAFFEPTDNDDYSTPGVGVLLNLASPKGPPRIGSFAQVASGAGWSTSMTLTNLSASTVNAQINFYNDNGSPLMLPLGFPGSTIASTSSPSVSLTIAPNQSVKIQTSSSSATTLNVGWADVSASGPLEGYAVFAYSPPAGPPSEGTVPLDTRLSSSLVLPYDNTNGSQTGIAFANQSANATSITVTVFDQSGNQLTSPQILPLAPLGHTSFFVASQFSQAANRTGIIEFKNPSGNLTGVGLEFYPGGTFTSLPIIQ
jgi:hypothetical protein